MRSSLLLATVVLMCCISVAQGRTLKAQGGSRRVTSVTGKNKMRHSDASFEIVGTTGGATAGGRRLLQQRQNTRSQEMLKNTQEQSRASMSPEAMLVEVSEERPHILAGAPVIPETDLEEHELVQATATTQAVCIDVPGWVNPYGNGCYSYVWNGWCKDGAFVAGKEWTGTTIHNSPEENC